MDIYPSLLLFIFGISLVAYLSLRTVNAARRERKLAEARLRCAQLVSDYNELLLNNKIKHGQVCHDEIYQLMLSIQALEKYPTPSLRRKSTADEAELQAKLEEEIAAGPPELAELMTSFVFNYYAMLRNRHPYRLAIYVLMLQIQLIFLRGFYRSLMLLLACIRFAEGRALLRRKWKQKAAFGVVAHTYGEIRSHRISGINDAMLPAAA